MNENEQIDDNAEDKPNEVEKALRTISTTLLRAYPEPKTGALPSVTRAIKGALQYIGVPALILAAILPVWELGKSVLDYSHREYIRQTYFDYAARLADEGEHERAIRSMERVEEIENFDAQAQFQIAKFSAEAEFFGGGDFQETEDSVQVLIELNENRPFGVRELGTSREAAELQILLNEIRIQRTRYADALEFARNAQQGEGTTLQRDFSEVLRLHEGIALIHMFEPTAGEQILHEISSNLAIDPSVRGRALHSLGTSRILTSDVDQGLRDLIQASEIFEELNDDFRLVRAIANIAMAYEAKRDWTLGLSTRREQEILARQSDDKGGILNALIGISISERNLGDLSQALATAQEAEAIAREINSPIGTAASLQNQANIMVRQQEYGQALYAAKSALPYFLSENDQRGVMTALGIIGRSGRELNNLEDAVFGYFGALTILHEIFVEGNVGQARDRGIYTVHLDRLLSGTSDAARAELLGQLTPRFQQLNRHLPFDFDLADYMDQAH